MEGCIELTGSEPNTTYFMKDSKIVAKRVISIAKGGTVESNTYNLFITFNNTTIVESWYNNDGKLHRDGDLPAVIHYRENGQKRSEYWYKDDKLHREGDLPAEIRYYTSGQKSHECWYKDGRYYRDGGFLIICHPETQAPIVSAIQPSVEDRLAKLEIDQH